MFIDWVDIHQGSHLPAVQTLPAMASAAKLDPAPKMNPMLADPPLPQITPAVAAPAMAASDPVTVKAPTTVCGAMERILFPARSVANVPSPQDNPAAMGALSE